MTVDRLKRPAIATYINQVEAITSDGVRQGIEAGNLTALSRLATTAPRLQADGDDAGRIAHALQVSYAL